MVQKCYVPGCKDKLTPRQGFPHPVTDKMCRFGKWIELIRNPDLQVMDPMKVYRCRSICKRHFSDDQFNGANRNFKLRYTALPNQFLPGAEVPSYSEAHSSEGGTDMIDVTNNPSAEELCISEINYYESGEKDIPSFSDVFHILAVNFPSSPVDCGADKHTSSGINVMGIKVIDPPEEDCERILGDNESDKESVMLENVKERLCRVCGRTEHSLTAIFGNTYMIGTVGLSLLEVMEMHLPIQLHADDHYPSNICSKCLNSLSEWHELYSTCAAADKAFESAFGKKEVEGSTIQPLNLQKEEVHLSVSIPLLQDHDYVQEKYEIKGVNSSVANKHCIELIPSNISQGVIFPKKKHTEKDISQNNVNNQIEVTEYQELSIPYEGRVVERIEQSNIEINFEGEKKENIFDELLETANDFSGHSNYIKEKFLCKYCHHSFKEREQLTLHHKDCQQTLTMCEICGKLVIKKGLRRHKNRTHGGQIICEKCGKCVSKGLLYAHMKSAHSGARYCELCCSVLPPSISYSAHMKNHTSGKLKKTFQFVSVSLDGKSVYICPVCDQSFDDKLSITKHLNEPIVIKCPTCHITVKNKKRFILHKCRSWNCQFCMKGFYNRLSWIEHERIHTGEKPHKCNECHISFRTLNQKTNHVRNHRAPAHDCKYCDRKFLLPHKLREHMRRIHEGFRFTCEVCGKKISTKWNMRKHLRRHRSIRVHFTCEICSKKFFRESSLKKHFQKHVMKDHL